MTATARNAQNVANCVALLFGLCAVIAGALFAVS
jgi:hypothetical protein